MFWAVLSSTLLAATPDTAIAITRFRIVQVDPALGGYAEDRLAARLAKRGFQVTTPADLEAVLGLERQRQLLGCSEDTSCLAEISSALGVPLVATGRLTRLGKRFELDVRVIRQKDGRVVVSDTRAVDDESRIGELLEQAADAIATALMSNAPPAPAPAPTPAVASTPFKWRLWVPLIVGVAAMAGGGVLIGTAESEYASFTTPNSSNMVTLRDGEISTRFQSLSTQRGLGIGLGVLGAALVATGIVWNALTPDAPVTVGLHFDAQSTSFTLAGRF